MFSEAPLCLFISTANLRIFHLHLQHQISSGQCDEYVERKHNGQQCKHCAMDALHRAHRQSINCQFSTGCDAAVVVQSASAANCR